MKRATVTIPDELDKALESYVRDQDAPPTLTVVMQSALRQFLAHSVATCVRAVPFTSRLRNVAVG